MKLTNAQIAHGVRRAESLRNRLTAAKKKTEKVTAQAVHSMEVAAGAFGFGALGGYSADGKGYSLMGVPTELIAGVGLHTAGFLGLGGKMSSHLHGFADGALASYVSRLGYHMGEKWSGKVTGGTGVQELEHRQRFVGKGADALNHDELRQAAEGALATVG